MNLPPVEHLVRFPDRRNHLVDVRSVFPTGEADTLELMMPVWAPGSYLVREFARHVEGLVASSSVGDGAGGLALRVEKTRKNRWRISRADGGPLPPRVVISYRLFARDLTVRTNYVDAELALLHGAGTWFAAVDQHRLLPHPHGVTVEAPEDWPEVAMPLPAKPAGEPGPAGPSTFFARNFDHLVDSPLFCGRALVEERSVDGRQHRLLTVGDGGAWPHLRAADDAARIAATEHAFWGTVPYASYLTVNLLADSLGGLEHHDSTVLLFPRVKAATRKGYLEWLGLFAHELFHAWNGKRLRPRELGPFDYENEVYTEELWFVEGITSYYDDLLVQRAGLASRGEYLACLSSHLQRLATTPGRALQSLSRGSYDTWIKFYRPDDNSSSSAVSYYLKGAVAAFVFDAAIRRAGARRLAGGPAALVLSPGDAPSLDVAMRLAFARHSGACGFTRGDIVAAFNEVADDDLAPLVTAALDGTGELDVAAALATFGLRLAPPGANANGSVAKGWTGWNLRRDDGRVFVAEARRDTPAARAGISAGDELLALDGYRVNPGGWDERLAICRPGDQVEVLLARRDRVATVPLTLGAEPPPLTVELDPAATPSQVAERDRWLPGN